MYYMTGYTKSRKARTKHIENGRLADSHTPVSTFSFFGISSPCVHAFSKPMAQTCSR